MEWKNVLLEKSPDLGKFTFQCQIFDTGEIKFFYNIIPVYDLTSVAQNPNNSLDNTTYGGVVVGISNLEPFSPDGPFDNVGDKEAEFYEDFLKVDLGMIRTSTLVTFKPKPFCTMEDSCEACTQYKHCSWCHGKQLFLKDLLKVLP